MTGANQNFHQAGRIQQAEVDALPRQRVNGVCRVADQHRPTGHIGRAQTHGQREDGSRPAGHGPVRPVTLTSGNRAIQLRQK